jgi:hypothetical protein
MCCPPHPPTPTAPTLTHTLPQADSSHAKVKDLDVLLADESMVLILDDTEVVWENHQANLIQVGLGCYVWKAGGGPPPL